MAIISVDSCIYNEKVQFFFFYIIANYIIDTVLVIDVGVQPNHVLLERLILKTW